MFFWKIIAIAIIHFIITSPTELVFGFANKFIYRSKLFAPIKSKLTNLSNKSVVVFVHGRNGWHTDFTQLISNMKSQLTTLSTDQLVILGYSSTDVVVQLENGDLWALRTANLGNTGHTSIDEDVASLRKELESYENCRIVLVGLSKGGVVVMRYATEIVDERIVKVMT